MALYSVDHRGGFTTGSYERSPVIALETDAAREEELPATVRSVGDFTRLENLAGFGSADVPRGADGVVTWLEGDRLLGGSPAAIRHDLRAAGRRCFVPVHLPCLEEMPLMAIQPRWFRAGACRNHWNFSVRISGSGQASPQALQALKANAQPWAQLSLGLLAEQEKRGSGIEILFRIWEKHKQFSPVFAALVLRNLAILMIGQDEIADAEELLSLGMKAYSGYAELPYLAALLCFRQHRESKALPFLEQARARDAGFLGCGGESSYRIDWLMGILAARVGNQRLAFTSFKQGMISDPVFLPAVEELLNLRLSPALIAAHQWEFCRAVRREPEMLDKVFEYLLLHRAFAAARRVVQTMPLTEDKKIALQDRLESAAAPFKRTQRADGAKPGVIVSGPFFEHSSLGRINREIAAGLLKSSELNVCVEPSCFSSLLPRAFAEHGLLEPALLRHPERLDLTIRHQWPPDLSKPSRGKLAVLLPWEYGAVPRVWIDQIERNVDQLWVPSQFVHDVFVRCGTGSERVEVIPPGFDPAVFIPDGPTSRPQGSREFVFLFAGGAIRRKGVDLLLEAYEAAFESGEDVSLVLAVSGTAGAYQHNSLMQQIQEVANNSRWPHVQLLRESFDDATLASLYRGCDAFVLPYRGEGFGMPLLEAMACGKPVITTARGPSQDFCSEKTGYLIPAREEEVPDDPPPLGVFVGDFTWFEPDFGELVKILRQVYEHREEAAQRGRAAAKFVREEFPWPQITRRYRHRVCALAGLGETKPVSVAGQP